MKEKMERQEAKRIIGKWCFWMALFCLILAGGRKVSAAALGNKQYLSGNDTTVYYDMNGDGRSDTITIHTIKENSYYYKRFKVYVNGKLALTKNIKGCGGMSIRYLSCSAKKNYLQIEAYADGGYMFLNKIYSYFGGRLVEAADLGRADNMEAEVTKVSKSGVTVKFSVQPVETGRIEWSFVYKPNGKKLKLKNNTVKVTSVLGQYQIKDPYQKYFKKNKFVTANGRTFYTSSGMKKKAFKTKRGDVLTLQKVKIVGKKMYLSFKKNGKTGWRRIKSVYSANNYWFYGVNSRLAG